MTGRRTPAGRWIDISVPLDEGLARWPGDPPFRRPAMGALERGDPANVTAVSMCLHTGTHLDAPRHYFSRGPAIDAMPAEAANGAARVIAIANPRAVEPEDLRPHRPRPGQRILLRTRNSRDPGRWRRFRRRFVALTPEGARYLVECRVRLVGIDYLSIGADSPAGDETHRMLLGAGVWVLEGLELRATTPGRYQLVCLPLRVAGADGAPARAFLRS